MADHYLLTLWFALHLAYAIDRTVKHFQARKRRKLIALRLQNIPR
jgi:predicted PurR-regulated permease PerM